MKKTIKTLVAVTLIAFVSFSFKGIESQVKEVKIEKSKIVWKGYKVTGSHEGLIALKSGSLTFDNETLTGGSFVVDMATIETTDLSGNYKQKLEGHLKSDDFFGVANHPTASLVFTNVKAKSKNAYAVTADLTIKGITKSIVFDLSVYGNKANASLKIDRAEYNVRYGSTSFFDGLKDKAIYDEFDLVVDLEF